MEEELEEKEDNAQNDKDSGHDIYKWSGMSV